MTDKRFKMGESDIQGEMIFTDTQTNKIYWQEYFDEIVDLLNELAEENKQLKFENETLKSNYQREIQSSIDFCNDYSKTNGELLEEIEKLAKENEQLKKTSKHWVFVDVDTEKGCNNCKHDIGSICDILDCGTHSWIDGVSECGLQYWESKI